MWLWHRHWCRAIATGWGCCLPRRPVPLPRHWHEAARTPHHPELPWGCGGAVGSRSMYLQVGVRPGLDRSPRIFGPFCWRAVRICCVDCPQRFWHAPAGGGAAADKTRHHRSGRANRPVRTAAGSERRCWSVKWQRTAVKTRVGGQGKAVKKGMEEQGKAVKTRAQEGQGKAVRAQGSDKLTRRTRWPAFTTALPAATCTYSTKQSSSIFSSSPPPLPTALASSCSSSEFQRKRFATAIPPTWQ